MRKELPDQRVPCLSTWYRHVNAGDVGVRYGETPYHPNRKPKGPRPHPAMTVPGRLALDGRPAGATNRSRFGHYEMDTVVSSRTGPADCSSSSTARAGATSSRSWNTSRGTRSSRP